MLRFLFIGCCFAFCLYGQSQPCDLHLSGEILISSSGDPLPFAQIHIRELDRIVLADSNGHFHFNGLCPGTYTLICNHQLCEHLEHEHHLHDATWLRLEATDKYMEVETINIHSERQAPVATQSVQEIGAEKLEQALGQSLGEILSEVPGVNRLQTGATVVKPVIHGLHSNRVLILNNGIRQEAQQWGSEHAPEIDPFLATNLKVIKGAASVRYGTDAMAGVILVEPAPLRDSAGIGGQLHMGGFSNGRQGYVSGMLEGNLGDHPGWSWRGQGTLRRGGNLHTPDYFLENTGLSEQNVSGAIQYKGLQKGTEIFYSRFHTKLGILSPAHVGSVGDWERALISPIPFGADTVPFRYQIQRPYQSVTHQLLKWQGYYRIRDAGKLTATYALQRNRRFEFDKHKPRGTDDSGKDKPELDYRIQTHTLETVWNHRPKRGFQGEWGLFGLYQNNALDGRPFIPNFVLMGADAFMIERWKRDRLEIEGGIRYDYRWVHSAREEAGRDIYTIRSYQSVSGTLGALIQLSPFWQLSVNSGTSWRPPHVNELFSDGLHHGAAAVEIGDSTLMPERSWKTIASLSQRSSNGWSGEFTAFFQYFPNFIFKRPNGVERTIRGTFPRLVYDQTTANLLGADVSVSYRAQWGLDWQAKASYLRSWNLIDQEPLIYMPANWGEMNLGWHWDYLGTWTQTFVKIGTRHVMEQTEVPIPQSPEEADFLPPPPAYTLWNVQAGTSLALSSGTDLRISASVENLFNVRYRDYLDRFRYFADASGRNYSLKLSFHF